MRRPTQRKLLLSGLILTFFFISLIGVYSIVSMRTVQREKRVVDRSLYFLQVLENLMDDVQEMESAQRGYIISGSPVQLEPYREGLENLRKDTVAVRTIQSGFPDKGPEIDRLLRLVEAENFFSEQNIRLKNSRARDSALKVFRTEEGKVIMDSIRTLIRTLVESENAVLHRANERRAGAGRVTAFLFGGMAILFFTGLFIVFIRIRKAGEAEDNYERLVTYLSDLKRAEAKLHASNERFEMITRTTNDAVWESNLETGELWGNETHQQLYGLKADDPVPSEEEWISRIHPDDRECMISKQAHALSSGENVFITEYRFNTVDKGYRNIYDRCYIVRNGSGKALRILGSMMDITERKQAELALQESEEKYRSMIEQASDGILILDGEGRFLDSNSAASALMGYTREEMKNLRATDVLPSGTLPVPTLKREELLAGKTVILERTLRKKNGENVETEVSYKMLSNGTILAIARDITEKKKTDEEIRKAGERFQMLSRATSDIVWDWDMQEDTIWWNDNYYLLLGLNRTSEKEPIGAWYQRIHPADLERVKADVQEGIRSGTSFYSHEYRFATADGTYLRFLDRAFILRGADNKAERMIGSMVNMTPIYEAQRVVAESENRLRTIINSEPQCIKLLDKDALLMDMNPAGLAMIEARSLEEVKGHNVLGLVDEADQPAFRRLLEDVFKGRSGSLIFHITGLKGTPRWLETHAVPMRDAAGTIIGMLGVTIDVTDKRKAEQELEQSYEAIRKLTGHIQNIREQERGHIAREIHDELGQQLTVLKMDVSWLNKRLGESDGVIREKMKGLLTVIDETVRSVRRISAELRPSLLDDLGLVAAIEWQLSEFEKRTGILGRFQGATEDIPLPDSIKTALFRIFQESLTNVVRHSQASSVTVQLLQEEGGLLLRIEDDGKGFDPKTVAEKRTLGILGMKERTTMIGGTYEIVSDTGKGTTVTVRVPL